MIAEAMTERIAVTVRLSVRMWSMIVSVMSCMTYSMRLGRSRRACRSMRVMPLVTASLSGSWWLMKTPESMATK